MDEYMIKGKDIVVVGQQPWDVSIGSNCKNIAEEFSKNNRVLYVNAPLDRITSIRNARDEKIKKRKNVIKGKENGIVKISENLWNLYPDKLVESITWINSHVLFNFLNKRNNRKFASSIKRAMEQLGFHDIILFNDNDIYKSFYLKELLNPAISIYYSRDFMLAVDYWKKHGGKLEPMIIAGNDLCVANSEYLADYCRKYNKKSFYVGQGCELEMFNPSLPFIRPKEVIDIRSPIIGYVGAIQSFRLDIDIILKIAEKKPEWTLVLVGPEDEAFANSKLHKMPNVLFTGPKSPTELPAYIKSFDICLNPQVLSEVTIGNYPRKIDEYLGMGKPVVATRTKAMEIFVPFVSLAETSEEYIKFISNSLLEDSPLLQMQRREFALSHTWENSVNEIYKAIHLSQK
ncbi:MAG: glycosyltransferase [Bacteroidota bacterium]